MQIGTLCFDTVGTKFQQQNSTFHYKMLQFINLYNLVLFITILSAPKSIHYDSHRKKSFLFLHI